MDALRGFAVLGILIMNIQAFSMISAAYVNPTAFGDLTGFNRWIWILSHLFADQKFMSVFSILFGAGVVLLSGKLESAGRRSAGLHYRRTLWLILFGLAHAYLLWYGDILVAYGICALAIFLFRRLPPYVLMPVGLAVFAVPSLLSSWAAWSIPMWPPEALEAMRPFWSADAEAVAAEVAAYRGGWLEQFTYRIPQAIEVQTGGFLVLFAWRVSGLMLMGMAFHKWGILAGARSRLFYTVMTAAGLAIGLSLAAYGVVRNFAEDWVLEYSLFTGSIFNYWGSLFVALAYIGMMMLVCKAPGLAPVTRTLGAVGRMAFTNYLLQTVICTAIFYGHGLGLFGRVDRVGQALIVVAVWALVVVVSILWLRRFRFGPAEWLWRSLTYRRLQPMRR
jgi:uncharacterized protein